MNPPEALRYILWRYQQEHTGADHQARLDEVVNWLGQVTLTPERIEALRLVLSMARYHVHLNVQQMDGDQALTIVAQLIKEIES